jgi:hypothetical protein
MHRAVTMRWGTIDGIEPQGLIAGVDDVVTGTCRDNDRIVALDLRAVPVDHDLSLALLNSEKLIPIVVDLFADLSTRFDRHQHQLKVLSCVEDPPKIAVILSQFLDIAYETFHYKYLRAWA